LSQRTKLAFVGARGAGKSRISRKLAKATGKPLLSTDMLIVYEAGGRSITDLVSAEGWPAFREREYRLLEKITPMPSLILDCGGGILVETDGSKEFFSERKTALLKQSAFIIYVKRPEQWLLARAQDPTRPALTDESGYRKLLELRIPWYEKAADCILDMSDRSIEEGIEFLQNRYGELLS
jgi:shikimate kinase